MVLFSDQLDVFVHTDLVFGSTSIFTSLNSPRTSCSQKLLLQIFVQKMLFACGESHSFHLFSLKYSLRHDIFTGDRGKKITFLSITKRNALVRIIWVQQEQQLVDLYHVRGSIKIAICNHHVFGQPSEM